MYMKFRLFDRAIKVVFSILFLSQILGCGSEPSKDTDSKDKTKPTEKEFKDLKIGVSMYTLGAPYFAAQLNAAKRRAESLGITFYSTNAQDDMVKQIANVEDMLARGIDLLILNPKDPKGLIPATKAATKAGVPVIIIDSSIDPSADFVTTIQSNNLRNGELIGEWLVKEMKGKPIKMALISGTQGNPVGKERRQGVFRGIIEQQLRSEGASSFSIVAQGWGNWTHEGGLEAMEDILVAHPEINVLLGENDSMTLGAMEAIKEADKMGKILILAAADGQKEALKLIKSGEYGATGNNNPVVIAESAIEIGLQVLQGKTDFPPKSYTPAVCITKENVDAYYSPDSEF
jgi:ribose transport system substrate-binding protein